MIKVERKTTEKSKRAIDSLETAKLKNGSYNTPEVNAALKEMFHGKCYICENKQITSYQIEHLISHHGNVDLKYDWNNLFLACAHCNNTKLDKFEPIIDCTKENVEELIAFQRQGYFGVDEKLLFDMLDSRMETQNTVKLLQEVYHGSTPQKKMEATILRRTLRKELSEFKEYVREYKEAEDEEREDYGNNSYSDSGRTKRNCELSEAEI
ncbi:MAG: HNH endonuclease [Ruminococcus flavefaciens]|nr:HNH endonuclease [Roseburia sp.]MCM1236424.1 HNH endonuclease [Ruminococcus flavefaciens]